MEICSFFCCCFVLGLLGGGACIGYFFARDKFTASYKWVETRVTRRGSETESRRTLRQGQKRRVEWDDEPDYVRADRRPTGRGQNRERGAEREIVHLQDQINELTRQLKNAQQPPDEEVARLRQEIADLTILMSDAKSPQNAEIAYLRRQINELTQQLQSKEHENDSDEPDGNA